jgi:hypothetical protein
MGFEVVKCNAALALGGIFGRAVWLCPYYAELRICKQAAEVLVSRTIRDQEVEPRFILEGHICADDRLNVCGDRRLVKARLTVNTVAIPECDSLVSELGRTGG